MEIMTYTTQNLWTDWFAIYLDLGGLGAAVIAISFLTHRFIREEKELVIWGALSGFIMLSIGSGLLFLHLMDKFAAIYILSPYGIIVKPDAWISWGSQFIVWLLVTAIFFAAPYIVAQERLLGWPLVGTILRWSWVRQIAALLQKAHSFWGWAAILTGAGVVVYTGLLLQSFPAVALWHNPAVPILFSVSATSTALAYLLIVINLFLPKTVDPAVPALYERLFLGMIMVELVIIFSFFNYLLSGSESGYRTAELLWNDMGWVVGFVGFGLIVPLLLVMQVVFGKWRPRGIIVVASVLVLFGGYMLRHYFMLAAVYAYPW